MIKKQKVTQKVKNLQDKRFQRTEKSIHHVLNRAIKARKRNLRVSDICRSAHITMPTFYQHSGDCDKALKHYEATLEREFRQLIPKRCTNKDLIFTILLNFVLRHQDYFRATTNSGDYWLIIRIFRFLRPHITSIRTSEQRFITYCHAQIAIICCWVQIDQLAPAQINRYTKQLCAT